jgi:hypothetical protein
LSTSETRRDGDRLGDAADAQRASRRVVSDELHATFFVAVCMPDSVKVSV